MLTNRVKFGVALACIKNISQHKRNAIIHHGLMGSAKNFRSLSKYPAFTKYVNTYLIDARNHGNSPHTSTHTVKDLADDLFQFIKTNNLDSQQEKLTLIGHSMGGLALMQFTKQYNSLEIQKCIDRVIIIDIPAGPLVNKVSFVKVGEMLGRMLEIDLAQPIQGIYQEIDKRALSKDIAALLKTDIIQVNENQYRWRANLKVIVEGCPQLERFNLAINNHKNWKVPVDLIYGQNSGNVDEHQISTYKQYYPQMTDENVHKISGAGHWVHFDKPAAFLECIDLILRRDQRVK